MKISLFQSKIFRKNIAQLLCLSIVLNTVLLPVSVVAEETPPPENTEQQSSPPPTETPAPTTNEIQTGDAGSQASTDTTVNYTETQTAGEISSDGCNVEVDLDCNPSTTNDAEVSGETSATSTSGINNIEGAEGSAEITTGDAVSQADGQNQLNTNIVEATEEATLEEVTGGEVEGENTEETVIEMDNTAELEATASAESVSGQNEITDGGGDATIDTGVSISQADQANVVNTNILGSNFEFFVLPITTDQNGDIDLNALWSQLQAKIAEASANLNETSNVYIINTNDAVLNLTADATSISGQNSAGDNAGGAYILTGDSIATASIFNLINLNIIGSTFLFGVINIFGNLTGNIIVPNPTRFLEILSQSGLYDESLISNQNYAYLSSNVLASADSGSNSQVDENGQTLETGDALAYASSTNFLNLNLLFSNWYFLLLNNFGFWDGMVEGWENPASSAAQAEESASYELNNPNGNQTLGVEGVDGGNTSVLNKNTAEVFADVSASAISGQNSTWANLFSFIRTGRSIALANLFNFLNTNIIGSNFFMPIINLFGSWKGNLVFAYADMQVSMFADKPEVTYGDNLSYTVNYENVGYEEARNVTLNIDLPPEASLNSVSGPTFSASGNHLQFFVGNVAAKSSGSFSIFVSIQKPTAQRQQDNLFGKLIAKIITPVEASEHNKELVTTANITTPDPEKDMSKNNFSVVTLLVTSEEQASETTTESNSNEDPGLEPSLEVASSNNTGDYVYPEDVITFFADVKNRGEGRAVNTTVYQDIVYEGQVLVQNKFDLGEIEGGKSKKLTFSIKVPKIAKGGVYESIIWAEGNSTLGKAFYSNDSVSEFVVKSRYVVTKPKTKSKSDGQVLAAEGDTLPLQNNWTNLLYLLVFALSLLWYVEYVRRREAEEELTLLLKKTGKKAHKFLPVKNKNIFTKILFGLRLSRS